MRSDDIQDLERIIRTSESEGISAEKESDIKNSTGTLEKIAMLFDDFISLQEEKQEGDDYIDSLQNQLSANENIQKQLNETTAKLVERDRALKDQLGYAVEVYDKMKSQPSVFGYFLKDIHFTTLRVMGEPSQKWKFSQLMDAMKMNQNSLNQRLKFLRGAEFVKKVCSVDGAEFTMESRDCPKCGSNQTGVYFLTERGIQARDSFAGG